MCSYTDEIYRSAIRQGCNTCMVRLSNLWINKAYAWFSQKLTNHFNFTQLRIEKALNRRNLHRLPYSQQPRSGLGDNKSGSFRQCLIFACSLKYFLLPFMITKNTL
jgi:hypothetical protein